MVHGGTRADKHWRLNIGAALMAKHIAMSGITDCIHTLLLEVSLCSVPSPPQATRVSYAVGWVSALQSVFIPSSVDTCCLTGQYPDFTCILVYLISTFIPFLFYFVCWSLILLVPALGPVGLSGVNLSEAAGHSQATSLLLINTFLSVGLLVYNFLPVAWRTYGKTAYL